MGSFGERRGRGLRGVNIARTVHFRRFLGEESLVKFALRMKTFPSQLTAILVFFISLVLDSS